MLSSAGRGGRFIGPNGAKLQVSKFNLRWFEELNLTPSVIFDVGCFDGGDAYRFQTKFPEAIVVAFEAGRTNYRRTKANLEGTKVYVIPLAITDRDGTTLWYDALVDGSDATKQGSIFPHTEKMREEFPKIQQSTNQYRVDCTRLDTFCKDSHLKHIDFLHVDVEGAEYNVISGMGKLRPQMIWLEMVEGYWEGAKSRKQLVDLLASMGYVKMAKSKTDELYWRAQ